MTNREASENEFLIDSGAATSVCQPNLSDSLGGKPSGAGVDLRSATGQRFTARVGRPPNCAADDWPGEINHISWTSG